MGNVVALAREYLEYVHIGVRTVNIVAAVIIVTVNVRIFNTIKEIFTNSAPPSGTGGDFL